MATHPFAYSMALTLMAMEIGCLLLFYIRTRSKVISRRAQTCDGVHACRVCSTATLGNLASSTMILYPTQSHYPETELTSSCPITIILSTWLESDKYHLLSHCLDSTKVRAHEVFSLHLPKWKTDALLLWPFRLFDGNGNYCAKTRNRSHTSGQDYPLCYICYLLESHYLWIPTKQS